MEFDRGQRELTGDGEITSRPNHNVCSLERTASRMDLLLAELRSEVVSALRMSSPGVSDYHFEYLFCVTVSLHVCVRVCASD